jgi:hypothetical protein
VETAILPAAARCRIGQRPKTAEKAEIIGNLNKVRERSRGTQIAIKEIRAPADKGRVPTANFRSVCYIR